MDISIIKYIVNFDLPDSKIDYIHRIGRAGRLGRNGTAITFFTKDDFSRLKLLINIISQSGGIVPGWLMNLSKGKNKKYKKILNATQARTVYKKSIPLMFDGISDTF